MKTKIVRLETVGSTNDYAKDLRKNGENLFVVAKAQSGGRGTKGRSFSSDAGGLYFSKLTFYKTLKAKDAFKIMQGAAAAVCETLSSFGLSPQIKWPNDIYVNGKKICGILIENALSGENISSSIVGVGLNINNALQGELLDIATTVQTETGKTLALSEVEDKLFSLMEDESVYEKYPTYLGFLGQTVRLLFADGTERTGVPTGVDGDGALAVQTEKDVEKFFAAEVSIRL